MRQDTQNVHGEQPDRARARARAHREAHDRQDAHDHALDDALPPAGPIEPAPPAAALLDRIRGGWIGRCLGASEAARFADGTSDADSGRRRDRDRDRAGVWGWERSDAVDRAVLSLRVMEVYGPGFTSAQVGSLWLLTMPFLRPGPAEQAAHLNLLDGLLPPDTAVRGNTQAGSDEAIVRGDLYGYVAPGDPRRAARLARKDACVSQAGEGLYAAMWAAALAAAAFTARDAPEAVAVSLRHVPVDSLLSVAVRDVLVAYTRGWTWEQAAAQVHGGHGAGTGRGALGNAGLITAGLLWGGDDPDRRIGLTVRGGWDIHTTAPVAGSIAGILHGGRAGWPRSVATRVRTGLPGQEAGVVADLAERTFAVTHAERR